MASLAHPLILHAVVPQAERKEMAQRKNQNMAMTEKKRGKLIAKKEFELADYIRKKIGEVGSGKAFYQSGR